jgi:hypothetical protein
MPAFKNFAASSGEHEIDLVRIPEKETLLNGIQLILTIVLLTLNKDCKSMG